MSGEKTTIALTRETRERLASQGTFGDSFDSLLGSVKSAAAVASRKYLSKIGS
jgi:hypothetical protein